MPLEDLVGDTEQRYRSITFWFPHGLSCTFATKSKGTKRKAIECPLMVKTYNNGMKGTNLMDQLKASYEVDCRYPKKFYLRVFFDLMNSGYVNAFIVCTKYMQDKVPHSVGLKTLKDFKHNVVMNLIGEFSSRKQAKSSLT